MNNSHIKGANSAVFGSNHDIVNTYNIVSGNSNKNIYGNGNAVFGVSLDSINSNNLVVGLNSKYITGSYNVVAGSLNNRTYGNGSAVFGANHDSIFSYNLVSGYDNNNITGQYNAVFGRGNTTANSTELVTGLFNVPVVGSMFTIGNGGSNSSRSNLFVVTNNTRAGGKVIYSAQLPTYASDLAADGDSLLPSGAFYKLTGSRAIYQKP